MKKLQRIIQTAVDLFLSICCKIKKALFRFFKFAKKKIISFLAFIKRALTRGVSLIIGAIDLVIFSSLLISFIIATVLFVWIIVHYFKCGLLSYPCYFTKTSDLVSSFGVFASVSIIPLISIIASIYLEQRKVVSDISSKLSEANNIKLFLLRIPTAEWNDFVQGYYTKNDFQYEKYPLNKFNYSWYLVFNDDFFQSYSVLLGDVTYKLNANTYLLRTYKNNQDAPYFVLDNTGVNENFDENSGTKLALLSSLNEDNQDLFFEIASPGLKHQEITFDLHFKERKEKFSTYYKSSWKHGLSIVFFPIFRSVLNKILEIWYRKRFIRLTLVLGNIERVYNKEIEYQFNKNKFQYKVLDLDISSKRNSYWKKYIKNNDDFVKEIKAIKQERKNCKRALRFITRLYLFNHNKIAYPFHKMLIRKNEYDLWNDLVNIADYCPSNFIKIMKKYDETIENCFFSYKTVDKATYKKLISELKQYLKQIKEIRLRAY